MTDLLLDEIEDEETLAAEALVLRERFRRFPCPWWRVEGSQIIARIGDAVVEIIELVEHVADALAIGDIVRPLPADVRESIVSALASALVAAYEDLYSSTIGHS